MSLQKSDGPSESGYHFVQEYQNCKRKFLYHILKGLESVYTSPAIIFGISGHAGLEEWYTQHQQGSQISKKVKFATEAAIAQLEEYRDKFYDPGKFETQKRQLKDTFQQYGLYYSNETFKVIEIERSYQITLKYGDQFTGRIDLASLWVDGQLMITDHKFTSWSLENFKRSVQASDQATAYMLLWNKNNPTRRASGVVFNLIRNYQGKIEFAQVPVYRGQADLDLFEEEVSENLRDMAQRIIDPSATWPKNTDYCFSYNQACPYLELCQGVKYDGLIGTHFKKKEQT